MRSLSLADRFMFDKNLFKSAVLITLTLCMSQFITRIDKACQQSFNLYLSHLNFSCVSQDN